LISDLERKVLAGESISKSEAMLIASVSGHAVFNLYFSSDKIRSHFRGDRVDVCAIVNARSGACSEDCAYCAQSRISSADIETFPLLNKDRIMEKAREAKEGGARRFCIVTSGRKISGGDLSKIAEILPEIRSLGLLPCATLGLLSADELTLLRDAGLERYHNNLETSELFFPGICTTHTWHDKIKTIKAVKAVGLSLCSGGIFGLGETWEDRVDMALALSELGPDSVPVNFLTPIHGTKLGSRSPLDPLEALKIISLYRFMLPEKEIRVCGGRMQTLGEFNAFVFLAGADGLLTGNYLTTLGRSYEDDMRLIGQYGLKAD
jgi:biotin synthase